MPSERNKALVQTIKKIPLFNGLSPTQIQKMLRLCVSKAFPPGETVCAQGTPSREMFILIGGELGIITTDGLQVVALKPVTTVGEMGLFTKQTRSASVKAIQPSTILVIDKSSFDLLLHDDTEIQLKVYRNVIEILSGKIVNDNVRIRDHLLDQVRYENQIREHRRRLEIALDLLEQEGLARDEAKTRIDEKVQEEVMRILVVDDEPTVRRFLKEVLSAYEVVEASNGEEALLLVQRARPDLVISDIRMPKMDGYALVSKLHEQNPDLPVLALSGYESAADVETHGFAGFVGKPVRVVEFRQTVEDTLGRAVS